MNIVINDIVKTNKDKTILSHVSFEAKQGKITGFLGPNGAGKSSTLRILLGLDFADSGSATFGSKKYVAIKNPLKAVGVHFDGLGGLPSRKVETHMKIIAMSNGIESSRVEEVLKEVDMYEKRKQPIGKLSLGEGQRVGIAIALLGNPQYLVFDEPTNGLDPLGIKWFREFICKEANKGKTVLLSSHNLKEVEEVCDEVVLIHKGVIKKSGLLADVKGTYESLEDAFLAFAKEEV